MTHVRTYADEVVARAPRNEYALDAEHWHNLCMAELVHAVRFTYMPLADCYGNERMVISVEISRVILGRDGYTPDGRYYGAGLPVFELELYLEAPQGVELYKWVTVRALSRKALRAELGRIFPNAKVGR